MCTAVVGKKSQFSVWHLRGMRRCVMLGARVCVCSARAQAMFILHTHTRAAAADDDEDANDATIHWIADEATHILAA